MGRSDASSLAAARAARGGRWSAEAARRWHAAQPWLVGCNFTPSYAINQLEFWQPDTFDEDAIERELGWAAGLGMNAARVYLHDLLWQHDAPGFLGRIERYLAAAHRHGIRTMPVLFDSCWHPEPRLGSQPGPAPGVHNSGWVQSPGLPALKDPAQHARLRDYVVGIVGAFAGDPRVLAWDIWNEPDNGQDVSNCDPGVLAEKAALVAPLLGAAFAWAREARPSQPLTSAIWLGDWSARHRLSAIQRIQLASSDVVSFHNYEAPDRFAQRIAWLEAFKRPILCTEYMARMTGSTFHGVLPIAKEHGVGAFNWGLVAGRTQTHLAWDPDHNQAIARGEQPWFHDVLHPDGSPFCPLEAEFLRWITGKSDLAARAA